ncbi:hypothetical protein VTK73DRAFT_10096 [Phialemonium thermophilum]|uniref:Uncharacterized protein n=1 Tax=Phialemonium thermophilum TaxID=223376 RepID=A0ABR3VYM0_9PEZI
MVMWAVLYYLPFYFEGVLGYSFIISSVGLLPLTLVVSPSAVVTGVLITVTGRYRVFLWSGWVVTVLGFGLMIKLGLGTSIAQWIFLTLPGGLGTGMILSSMQIAVQAASRDEDVAVTVAMVPELRTFGQALGLAIFGSVFSNTVRSKLGDIPSSLADPSLVARLGSDPIQLVEVIRHTADGPLKEELKRAMWLSTRAVWIAGLGFYAVSAIASLAARHYDLNKVLSSEHKVKKEKPATEAI